MEKTIDTNTPVLGILPVGRENIIEEIQKILKNHMFYGKQLPKLDGVEKLLAHIRKDVHFLLEYPYTDKHYRDTYYNFYSLKHKEYSRNCIRVHIFGFDTTNFDWFSNDKDISDEYLGFFIIRPLLKSLGRSLISPNALETFSFVCCLMKTPVSLLGRKLELLSFPHVAKDGETHICAESSLWSLVEYFGSKYSYHVPLLPSQIIKNLLKDSKKRILPSTGLRLEDMEKILQDNGFQCLEYRTDLNSDNIDVFRIMRIYVESGIPLLLTLTDGKDGHAVLVIGRENSENLTWPGQGRWTDESYYSKDLVFIDDNVPPYQIVKLNEPTSYYSYYTEHGKKYYNAKIEAFIVPVPTKAFLTAEKAHKVIMKCLSEVENKIEENYTNTRIFLATSSSYKQFLFEQDTKISESINIKNALLILNLPKSIWLCEIYKKEEKGNGYCSGLLIIDATGSDNLSSVLWFSIGNQKFTHDGVKFWESEFLSEEFKSKSYNNLKGDRNKWRS